MTMLALTLSVGIVIDDAIVVLENIYRFIEEKHDDQFQAAVDGDEGDRPRRAGDDAVARRDLRPGRLHGRHRRPLHEELRPDDGVRDHGVAARQLHADADAVGALAEGRTHGEDGSSRRRTRASSTPSTRVYTRLLEWSMAHRGDRRRRGGARAARRACRCSWSSNKNFLPQRRSVGVRDQPARAGGHEPRVDRSCITNRVADARPRQRCRRSTTRWCTIAGDPAQTRNLGNDLRAAEAARRPQARSVRGDGRRSATDVLPPLDGEPADVGAAGRQHRRRRQPERRHPVHRSTDPTSTKLEQLQPAAGGDARKTMPGVVDVDTSLNVGKPELSVQRRSAEGGRPRRADRRRGRSAAPAGRRRPGDDLQRGRRAVRGAPARAGGRTAARRRPWRR